MPELSDREIAGRLGVVAHFHCADEAETGNLATTMTNADYLRRLLTRSRANV
jgi:hypothetical protein